MIDTGAIRGKIIDLALQGKLSSRNDTDSNVEQLLEMIFRKNELNASIPVTDLPFEIPQNWRWIKLGWVMNIDRGGSPRPIKAFITNDPNGINWIKIGDVAKDGKYITETKERIRPEGEKKSRRVYPGDFLLTNSMSFGRPYISKIEGCIHDGWLVLRNTENVFDLDFLYYLLSSTYAYSQFTQKATGSTVDNLNKDKVGDAIVPLPPIEEQKRIVTSIEDIVPILKTIDNLQERYINDREILKSKLIDAAIQGKLTEQLSEDGTAEELFKKIQEEKAFFFKEGKVKKEKSLPVISGAEAPFEIPGNWKWVHIKDVGITVTGNTPSKSRPDYYGGEYPFYKPADLDAGRHITKASEYLTESGWSVSRQLNKGAILVCCIGSIGKCAIIDNDGTANQQINALSPVLCDSDYLMLTIESNMFKRQLDQGSRATTVSIINKSKFDSCIIPLPPLSEQKRIVDRVNKLLQSTV